VHDSQQGVEQHRQREERKRPAKSSCGWHLKRQRWCPPSRQLDTMAQAHRARRRPGAEFKQRVLAESDRPGPSVAAVAL